MPRLTSFLIQKQVFILFLILEGMALFWIINSHSYQRAVLIDSSNWLSGNILESYHKLFSYLDLKNQNDQLAKENAQLRSLLKNFHYVIAQNRQRNTIHIPLYSYIEANVLNSSYLKHRNYITINRGSKHGVKPEMGVTGPAGAVGIIKSVSENFATVIPLINSSLWMSGKFKKERYFGPLNWPGESYRFIKLSDIPSYAEISKGDTIETDTRSLIFPMGTLLGTVDTFRLQSDKSFYEVDVKLATDFSSLGKVYVVTDKMKSERKDLENNSTN